MTYRIVIMRGGSWYPISKKHFNTFKSAVSYRKGMSKRHGTPEIVESNRVHHTMTETKMIL